MKTERQTREEISSVEKRLGNKIDEINSDLEKLDEKVYSFVRKE